MEAEILQFARELQSRTRLAAPSFVDRIMDAAMEDDELKADLFRLLDVLPMLSADEEVSRHVREYLLSRPRKLPPILATALQAAGTRAFAGVASRAIRGIATQMAERFIAGATVPRALESLARLHHEGFASSADLLGESTVSDAEGDEFLGRYTELIETLSSEAREWEPRPLVDAGPHGPLPRANVSLKLSSLTPRLDPLDHTGSVERLVRRLYPVFRSAKERGAALVIDMEQWELHGIAWDVFEGLVTTQDLAGWPHFGIVVQAYLTSARADAERLLALARRRGAPLSVRLVKGAYWDYEVAHARQHGYPCPVLLDKGQTDASFETLSELLLRNVDLVYPGIGSHNLRSISHAIVAARQTSVPQGAFELQVLYGMADAQRDALRTSGSGCASTVPSASFCRESPTWFAGSWKTAPTPDSCGRAEAGAGRSKSWWRRPRPLLPRLRLRLSARRAACSSTVRIRTSPTPESGAASAGPWRRSERSYP